ELHERRQPEVKPVAIFSNSEGRGTTAPFAVLSIRNHRPAGNCADRAPPVLSGSLWLWRHLNRLYLGEFGWSPSASLSSGSIRKDHFHERAKYTGLHPVGLGGNDYRGWRVLGGCSVRPA